MNFHIFFSIIIVTDFLELCDFYFARGQYVFADTNFILVKSVLILRPKGHPSGSFLEPDGEGWCDDSNFHSLPLSLYDCKDFLCLCKMQRNTII